MFDRQSLLKQSEPNEPQRRMRPADPHKLRDQVSVGAVDDSLEQEAHQAARRVLQSSANDIRSTPSPGGSGMHGSTSPSGLPLDSESAAFFESRFGYDFSKVRIHADQDAAASARSIGALAFTAGPHIAFDRGRYHLATTEGRRLLAHELAHVVQQGHAGAIAGHAGRMVAPAPNTPAIQRDTGGQIPPVQQAPQANPNIPPLAITKRYEPDLITRAQAVAALTTFLYQVQTEQGGQLLRVTETVRFAVLKMFEGDPMAQARAEGILRGTGTGDVPTFAKAVGDILPENVPSSRVAHLGTLSPKEIPDTRPKSVGEAAGKVVVDSTVGPIVKKLPIPESWKKTILDGAKGAVADGMVGILDQALSGSPLNDQQKGAIHSAVEALIKQKAGSTPDRQQEGAGSPYAPVQPPATKPPLGSASVPGEHIFNLPPIKWDIPTKAVPKPNLPQAPLASDAKAVDAIIQGLDDSSLIPAAAKDTENAGNFASAKELARSLANMLAAANKKKQYSVELTIPTSYRHVEDLRDIFDRIEAIVRQIASAIPGGVPNVGEVVITPARTSKDDTFPARRIVKLGGGN